MKPERRAALIQCCEQGMSQKETAQALGLHASNVHVYAKKLCLKFARGYHYKEPDQRSRMMAALYRDGYTLQQIGDQYGITRERVRQVITKLHGLRWRDGGLHARALKNQEARRAARNERYLAKYGCTFDQWKELSAIGRDMRSQGRGGDRVPLRAFSRQKCNAKIRDIAWELNLLQWWDIWQRSGKWAERGRGQGYVMCRRGDVGPYAVGNVFIAPARVNSSEAKNKKSGLPIGVLKRKGRFEARRCIDGKVLRLGSHPTPELAHAAYLASLSDQFEASAA